MRIDSREAMGRSELERRRCIKYFRLCFWPHTFEVVESLVQLPDSGATLVRFW
jgi:hypothetical protein